MKKQRVNPLILITADASLDYAQRLLALQQREAELREKRAQIQDSGSKWYLLLLPVATTYLQ